MSIITAQEIAKTLLNAKGQFSKARWKTVVKTSAKFKNVTVEKITEAVVRSGIDYSKLSSVKEGIASGERNEVGSLPWGSWLQFPYLIGHKGKTYVRLYPSLSPNHVPKVKYFIDGVEVSKVDVLPYLTPGEAKKLTDPKEAVECFTIKEESILGMAKA